MPDTYGQLAGKDREGAKSMTQSIDRLTVDPAVLERLGDELGDMDAARRIAGLYLELLDDRVRALGEACDAGDVDTAIERTLSLKVTSATVGATNVRECAESVERGLREDRLCRIVERLERLRRAAADMAAIGFPEVGAAGRGI